MPSVLSEVLNKCGYDNAFSIENMNDVEINSIETFVQDHLQLVNSDLYAHMDKFRFLPGHRTFLIRLPEAMKRFISESKTRPETSKKRLIDSLPLSFLMKEMIHNAISNAEKDPNNRRYSETIQSTNSKCKFHLWVYLLSDSDGAVFNHLFFRLSYRLLH